MIVELCNKQVGTVAEVMPKLVDWEVYICSHCFYKFDELKGDAWLGIAPHTEFTRLPLGFRCPGCGACRGDFFPAHSIGWA